MQSKQNNSLNWFKILPKLSGVLAEEQPVQNADDRDSTLRPSIGGPRFSGAFQRGDATNMGFCPKTFCSCKRGAAGVLAADRAARSPPRLTRHDRKACFHAAPLGLFSYLGLADTLSAWVSLLPECLGLVTYSWGVSV
ncbi:hypothetical protein SKAU_G00384050 [Synaphobranchus kaupii]|uniref:Uncharacterized protein n=1 Tax=Synaphobranchus kaupii TaxID=118154 RepID=A0A9Q1IE45_SYNKA|nr:hypothetical protein SKAU_G00384050 [Synaphobranchus kaupii]